LERKKQEMGAVCWSIVHKDASKTFSIKALIKTQAVVVERNDEFYTNGSRRHNKCNWKH
jgi:hypothetical protein